MTMTTTIRNTILVAVAALILANTVPTIMRIVGPGA